jgi:hypothetical protein
VVIKMAVPDMSSSLQAVAQRIVPSPSTTHVVTASGLRRGLFAWQGGGSPFLRSILHSRLV